MSLRKRFQKLLRAPNNVRFLKLVETYNLQLPDE
jgi:hypothetical protein